MGLQIQDLPRPKGLKKKGKRIGRGIGSGKGKTSGKGHKGAKARSGGAKYNPGFEGGQMPLVRRIPKRGFTNKFRKEWTVINLANLERLEKIVDGTVIDKEFLFASKIVKKKNLKIKILAKGILKKKLTVKAEAFSEAAKAAIEKAGGKAELVID
ncbi:MAG: 50S ribosomal protein L15 [Candidatus Omnitrophica bacterium]|nr:50S ribosomal protein L15 [Candidatus Omnitrophota bacterium]